ncbi:hypothetical protein F2P79_005060 [Pimephales promelas]|nr:hypothetical protein F2P79_005060 [Pimephales promelas]
MKRERERLLEKHTGLERRENGQLWNGYTSDEVPQGEQSVWILKKKKKTVSFQHKALPTQVTLCPCYGGEARPFVSIGCAGVHWAGPALPPIAAPPPGEREGLRRGFGRSQHRCGSLWLLPPPGNERWGGGRGRGLFSGLRLWCRAKQQQQLGDGFSKSGLVRTGG